MRRICVVVTARPSYARIKTVLTAINEHPDLELLLVVSGSALLDKYGSVIDVIKADGFEPSATIHMLIEGENLVTSAKSTGLGIMELADVVDRLKPDVILSIADRYETISTAIVGAYLQVPVAHLQGGEVTGSIDEKVRHAVTKLSDIHLVSNEPAANRVRGMGEYPQKVFITGCPSIDLADYVCSSDLPLNRKALANGVGADIDPANPFIVVMQHPVTYEWEAAREQFEATLNAVHDLGIQTYWFWPNVDAGSDIGSKTLRRYREHTGDRNIHFLKNLQPEDFLNLLKHALCLVGNSSTGIRESAYLGLPVVNVGTRQKGRDKADNVIDTDYDSAAIKAAIKQQLANGRYSKNDIYGDGKASEKIVKILSEVELSTEKKIVL